MSESPIGNTLKRAISIAFTANSESFVSRLSPALKDNLFRVRLGNRSLLNATLKTRKLATNFDIELYALKDSRRLVLQRIGSTIFGQLGPQALRRNLKLIASSTNDGDQQETIRQVVEPGEYVLRVVQQRGKGRYQLELQSQTAFPQPNQFPGNLTFNWLQQFGGSLDDSATGLSLSNEKIYVSGTTEPGTLGRGDNYVAQYSTSGDRLFSFEPRPSKTTSVLDPIQSIVTDSEGNYYALGQQYVSGPIFSPFAITFIAKYSATGVKIWEESVDVALVNEPQSIEIDHENNILIAGYLSNDGEYSSYSYRTAPFLTKLNGATGQIISDFDNEGTVYFENVVKYSRAQDIAVDRDGNIYVAGVADVPELRFDLDPSISKSFVTKINGDTGDSIWLQLLEDPQGSNSANSIVVSNDSVYIAGATSGALTGQSNAGSLDGFLAKFSTADGGLQWVNQFGTAEEDEVRAIAIDAGGNLYIAGSTGASLFGLSHSGGADVFISIYDPTGGRLSSTQFGSDRDDTVAEIAVDIMGAVYIVGRTQGSLTGAISQEGSDAWIAKYQAV